MSNANNTTATFVNTVVTYSSAKGATWTATSYNIDGDIICTFVSNRSETHAHFHCDVTAKRMVRPSFVLKPEIAAIVFG